MDPCASVHFVPCGLLLLEEKEGGGAGGREGGREEAMKGEREGGRAGLHVAPPSFSPLVSSSFSHGRTRVGGSVNPSEMSLLNSPNWELPHVSPSAPFLAAATLVFAFLLSGPVGHWVSVTVHTNMLRHAFDRSRPAYAAPCCCSPV